ncbi:MAG: hypothetical protein NVS3B12_03890 [Acidimicrobiales bacterium]
MTDDLLLERLGAALRPVAPAEPPSASLAALFVAVAASTPVPARARPSATRSWARRVAAAGAALAAVGAGTGVAFAAGVPVPGIVREAAHDAGLPVDSAAVVAVLRADHALHLALDAGRPEVVEARAADLRRELRRLDTTELAHLDRSATADLSAADRLERTRPLTQPEQAQDDRSTTPAKGPTPPDTTSDAKPAAPAEDPAAKGPPAAADPGIAPAAPVTGTAPSSELGSKGDGARQSDPAPAKPVRAADTTHR